jgi:hypothetical protein
MVFIQIGMNSFAEVGGDLAQQVGSIPLGATIEPRSSVVYAASIVASDAHASAKWLTPKPVQLGEREMSCRHIPTPLVEKAFAAMDSLF